MIDDYFKTKRSHPARKRLHVSIIALSVRHTTTLFNICMQHVIRKACKEVDVWGKKTFLQVPAAKKFYIFDRVSKLLLCATNLEFY